MTFIDLFWIFFMLSALQPVLRQSMLEAMRTRKIAQLERKRGSRVILLVRLDFAPHLPPHDPERTTENPGL